MPNRLGRLATAGSVGGLALIAGGFAVRPRRERSVIERRDIGKVLLRDDLPILLRRHLDPDGDGFVPQMDTLAMWSRPYMRRGSLPRLALRMRSVSRVGESFVNDIEMTWYGFPILRVVDAFVDGHGITKIGCSATIGDEIDQGANLFQWSEAVFVPSAFRQGSPIVAEKVGSDEIRLTVPLGSGHDEAGVRFVDGHPARFSALRHIGSRTPQTWWHVDYLGWHMSEGIQVPRHMDVTWEDERRPWLSFDLDGFVANVEVEQRLLEVGALIEGVRARANQNE